MRSLTFFLFLVLLSCGTERMIDTETSDTTPSKKPSDVLEFYYSPYFDSIADQYLIQIDTNSLTGFKNLNGEWIIPPTYDRFSGWFEGVSVVRKEGKLGAINIQNEVVIPFSDRWKKINSCKSGVFLVLTTDDEYTYISKKGKQLIPFQKKLEYPPYPRPKEFENGICIVGEKLLNSNHRWRMNNNSSYYVVNNQFDTLLAFKDTWFKIKLGKSSEGFTPIYLYPDMKYGGEGVNYGYYGYLNEKGEIAIDIQFSSEYFWGVQSGMSVNYIGNAFNGGVAQNRFGDSIIYIDTLGNRLDNALPYNKYGIGVKHSRDSIWIINKGGDTLLAEGREFRLGGFGHSLVGGSTSLSIRNDFIHVVDSRNRIQYYYSPDFKKLAEFDYSSRDSIYHQMTFTPSDQVLFGIETVARGTTSESLTSKRIFDHSGNLLCSVIPPLVEVFPKIGCYIDYRPDSLGNRRCRLMNYNNEVLFEDSTVQVVSIGKTSHDYGLFRVEKVIRSEYSNHIRLETVGFINHLGKMIARTPESSLNYSSVTNYTAELANYTQSETIHLNVDLISLFITYRELNLDEFQRK
jgi:hypothetical protein